MKGKDITRITGITRTHCAVGKEIIELDPEHDYATIRGTDEHPRVICEHHEKMILAGKYPRLSVKGREVVSDLEWVTGHHPFEGDVEPKRSPERLGIYMVK